MKLRFYHWYGLWAVLGALAIYGLRHDPYIPTAAGIATMIAVTGFLTLVLWSAYSVRQERKNNTALAKLRRDFADRLAGHIGNLMLKGQADIYHLLETNYDVARLIIKSEGWWPAQYREFAVGSLRGQLNSLSYMAARKVDVDHELLNLVRNATEALIAEELDVEWAEKTVAAVEHESLTRQPQQAA